MCSVCISEDLIHPYLIPLPVLVNHTESTAFPDGSQILPVPQDHGRRVQSEDRIGGPAAVPETGLQPRDGVRGPPAVRVFCFKPNIICCMHRYRQGTGAPVRGGGPELQAPEVYKGKGIMYVDEVVKKKQGKKSK
uniref:Ribosomal protein L6 alpha-beta domain-containing protein n=1 Tax=Ananas comosus var. bracteatus TaxID=296719 RepID=A0A6V7PPU4_ANACO|nr:unnamed protein product [Ananas comosus var. bracteatus]